MEEKTMINDIIKDLKFSINDYQTVRCKSGWNGIHH